MVLGAMCLASCLSFLSKELLEQVLSVQYSAIFRLDVPLFGLEKTAVPWLLPVHVKPQESLTPSLYPSRTAEK